MSHYECTDCGYPMGISYGECERCTPEEVKKVIKELECARDDAEVAFDKKYKKVKEKFIKEYIADTKKKHDKLFKAHKPKK